MAYEAALAETAPNASSASDTGKKKMPDAAAAAAAPKLLYELYPFISELLIEVKPHYLPLCKHLLQSLLDRISFVIGQATLVCLRPEP